MSDLSIREQAIRAVVALLATADGSPAHSVSRSRLDQIGSEELPCFDVTPGVENDDDALTDHDAWGRLLELKVRALIDATDADDGALDPFYVFAVRTLMADPTLGRVVSDINWRGVDAVFRPEGRDIIGLEMTFELKFAVERGEPTRKG